MIGVTIVDRDQYGTLVPTLSELLTLLTGPAMLLTWILSDVAAVGSEAEALQEAAEADRRLTFDELLQLAKGVAQVIDGEFVGYIRAASYGWTLGGAIGLAMIEAPEAVTAAWLEAGTWQVDIAGRLVPARVSLRPFYDPTSARVRS